VKKLKLQREEIIKDMFKEKYPSWCKDLNSEVSEEEKDQKMIEEFLRLKKEYYEG
jgi:hypothetical protein